MSVFSIGALVGALASGLLSDLAGRKVTLIVGGSLYALGGTLQTFSFFLWSGSFTIPGVPHTLPFATASITLGILVPGLSGQFLPYFPIRPAFKVTTSQ